MDFLQVGALVVMATFYIAYYTKMFLQRRKGIQTNQINKGEKSRKVLRVEFWMKIATFLVVPAELVSIFWNIRIWDTTALRGIGIAVGAAGGLGFILAMATMRDSWRAGIPAKDKTELVTTGIYRLSRNPAFLGFDLVYLGLLVAFFNPVHMVFTLFAVIMLHFQILQEEAFLSETFGKPYLEYKQHTGRYFLI